MPWTTPTLKTLRQTARSYIMSALEGADSLIPNSVCRVMADCNALLTHLVLQFIAWLALQLLPVTSSGIWLDRWATMYLINADHSRGRKQAQFSSGTATATFNLPSGGTIDAGGLLAGANGVTYQVTAQTSSSVPGVATLPVVALTAGSVGNLDPGSSLSFVS